jgi:hypothetical protein
MVNAPLCKSQSELVESILIDAPGLFATSALTVIFIPILSITVII